MTAFASQASIAAFGVLTPTATFGKVRWFNGAQFRILLNPEDTQGDLGVVEIVIPAGCEPPPHVHRNEDETFLLHEGQMRFLIGDEIIEAKPGMIVFAPRGIRHAFEVLSPTARYTMIVTPGDFVNYFKEISSETFQEKPAARPGPDQIRDMVKILDRYDIQLV